MKKEYSAPPSMTIDPNKQYTATFQTSRGEIVCDLFTKDAPKTVNNFVFLAREKFYDGTVFHRERRPEHKRQPIFYHPRRDRLAEWQTHRVRPSSAGTRNSRRNSARRRADCSDNQRAIVTGQLSRPFVAAALSAANGANGMSDIEGEVAREAMSECGQRASFKSCSPPALSL